MYRTQQRGAAVLLALSLTAVVSVPTMAQGGGLDAALAAVGGADALSGLTSFVVESSGERNALDEGPIPGGPAGLGSSFDSVASIDVAGDRLRIDYAIGGVELAGAREVSEVITGNTGFADGANSIVAPPGLIGLLSDRVASIRIHQDLLNPHLLLLDALADPSMAVDVDGGVEFTHGPTPIRLKLADDRTIAAASTLESDPLRGDVELVVTYDDWTDAGSGVWFPGSVEVAYDGEIVHGETRSVRADVELDTAIFEVPEGLEIPAFDADLATRGDINHQYLQSFEAIGFPLDGFQPLVQATEVAPGVHHLTGGSHHSLAVIGEDGVVIVEAPLNDVRVGGILAWLEEAAPELPVTHVVQSHHHVDHSGGLRFLAGTTGATVIAAESALQFYAERVLGATFDIIPDGIDGSSIEMIGVGSEPVTIGSGEGAVTVYAFPNEHAEDFLLVEAGGALFVVDIYNPGLGFGPPPAALFDWVADQGLELDQLVGGHAGIDAWADLVAANG